MEPIVETPVEAIVEPIVETLLDDIPIETVVPLTTTPTETIPITPVPKIDTNLIQSLIHSLQKLLQQLIS